MANACVLPVDVNAMDLLVLVLITTRQYFF